MMKGEEIEAVEQVIDRLRQGFIVTRFHIRTIGHLAEKYGVHRTTREDYINYLRRLLRAIERGEK